MNATLRLPLPLRVLLALWLLLGLGVAPVQAARHAGAMASGQLVCSAAGAYLVGADGELLPADRGGHDCCQAAASALPPAPAAVALPGAIAAPPATPAVADRAAAAAALPPARGPPALRGVLTVLR